MAYPVMSLLTMDDYRNVIQEGLLRLAVTIAQEPEDQTELRRQRVAFARELSDDDVSFERVSNRFMRLALGHAKVQMAAAAGALPATWPKADVDQAVNALVTLYARIAGT